MKKVLGSMFVVFMVISIALSGCTPAATTTATTAPAATEAVVAATEVAAAATEAPAATEAAAAAEPQAGGTIVFVGLSDWPTLDIQKETGWGQMENMLYSFLITVDPATSQYVPYMAESWTISADGTVYTFKLRQDLKFDNGDPLNANDFVYTITRAQDPATKATSALQMWGPVKSAKALDDYTLELTLTQANSAFLYGLAMAPATAVDQKAIEAAGDDYAFKPVGNGPYKLASYTQGDKLVLERNPNFTWAPPFIAAGGPYIDNVEFRIIPEYATQIAGLEAGEVTGMVQLDYADLDRIKNDGNFDLLELPAQGVTPFIAFNLEKAPFNDVNVRKAFAMATNRDSLITLVLQGNGTPLYQPLTTATIGYNPALEEKGIQFDLEGAKELMKQAGYTYGADGMLITPEGQPFVLDFPVVGIGITPNLAQVLVSQYKDLGVTLNINLVDPGTFFPKALGGDYQITVVGMSYGDAEILPITFISTNIGSLNISRTNDPALDELLNAIRAATDLILYSTNSLFSHCFVSLPSITRE